MMRWQNNIVPWTLCLMMDFCWHDEAFVFAFSFFLDASVLLTAKSDISELSEKNPTHNFSFKVDINALYKSDRESNMTRM